MENYLPLFYIASAIFGAILGSFACCQAWRIHEKQKGRIFGSRSVCMSCKHQLKWYDNIPVISWISLRGKCRYCKAKIGYSEILSELGLAAFFVAIAYAFGITPEAFILMTGLVLYWILLVYDAKWGELPVILMLVAIPFAIAFQFAVKGNIFQILLGTGFLTGIYYLLYFFSKEKLVGGGDWILCISIAIFLGRIDFVIVELFLSNFGALLAGAPQVLKKDKKQIPFGPFLIIAMALILIFRDFLLKFFVIY